MYICCVKFRDIYMCELGCICLLKPCLDLVVKIVKRTCHISMGISWECIYSVRSRIGAYWSSTEDGWIIFTIIRTMGIGMAYLVQVWYYNTLRKKDSYMHLFLPKKKVLFEIFIDVLFLK